MNNKKDIVLGTISLLLYFFLTGFSNTILQILHIDYTNWSTTLKYIFNIGYELFTLIIIILILRKTIYKHFKEYMSNPKYYLRNYIKYWFINLGLMYLCNFIIIFITKDIAQNEQSIRTLFETNPITTFILAGLIAPILEELVFRLSIYKIIGKQKYIFIILSGLIFGSMHIIGLSPTWKDWLYIIPYSLPGCIFAYTLVKSDNICVPISLHMIHNIFSLTLQAITIFLK